MAETHCSQTIATSAYITEMADYRKAGESLMWAIS